MTEKSEKSIIILPLFLCWFCTKLIAINAWVPGNRMLPVVPLFNFLEFENWIHLSLYIVSLVCIFISFFKRVPLVLGLLIVNEIISCSLDILRWQPSQYLYIFMALCYLFTSNADKLKSFVLIIFSSTYIYAGLQKFNGGFLHSVWENLILKRFFEVEPLPTIHYMGLIIPLIEIAAGIALLFCYKRKTTVITLISMHIFLVIMLVKVKYNYIVLPYNLFMAVALIAFYNGKKFQLSYFKNWQALMLLIFWGLLPAFNFIGLWDHYLSSSLYSGKLENLYISLDDPKGLFKNYYSKVKNPISRKQRYISVQQWAMAETYMGPYPERWYYEKFKDKFEDMYEYDNTVFVIRKYPYKSNMILE